MAKLMLSNHIYSLIDQLSGSAHTTDTFSVRELKYTYFNIYGQINQKQSNAICCMVQKNMVESHYQI